MNAGWQEQEHIDRQEQQKAERQAAKSKRKAAGFAGPNNKRQRCTDSDTDEDDEPP